MDHAGPWTTLGWTMGCFPTDTLYSRSGYTNFFSKGAEGKILGIAGNGLL